MLSIVTILKIEYVCNNLLVLFFAEKSLFNRNVATEKRRGEHYFAGNPPQHIDFGVKSQREP